MKVRLQSRYGGRCGRGYTLVEMVVSITILGIIGLVCSGVILESMRVYSRTVPALDAGYKTDLALRTMKREIRDLQNTTSITSFGATAFSFKDSANNIIAYALSNGNLTRNGDLLAAGVTSLTFRYWQSDGNTASTAAKVHLIEVDLTVQNGDQSSRARTQIFPRNLGLPL
jgi:prepilin-type N-terminal cleavage/methylation domain-containing protein